MKKGSDYVGAPKGESRVCPMSFTGMVAKTAMGPAAPQQLNWVCHMEKCMWYDAGSGQCAILLLATKTSISGVPFKFKNGRADS